MPDVYLCMDGVPVWVELKIIKRNGIVLQPSQIAWHTSHSRCGGVSFFLGYSPSEGLAFLFDGADALKIQGARCDVLRPMALSEGKLCDVPATLRLLVIERLTENLRPATCA